MKTTRLVIQNFLSVKDAALNLKDKGLVSIEGENLDKTGSDSNGSGKSSIINAIIWCLYGNYGKDEGADDVVNSTVGKNCMVQLTLEDMTLYKECMYRITRYRKHSKHKNKVTVEQMWIPMAQGDVCLGWKDITKAGAQAVQQQINDIMGADETVFRAACFWQQENPIDIPAMTDKELKALLERFLPFEELNEAHARVSELVTAKQTDLNKLEIEWERTVWSGDRTKSELKLATANRDSFKADTFAANHAIQGLIDGKQRAIEAASVLLIDKGKLEAEILSLTGEIESIGYSDVGMAKYRLKDALGALAKLEKELAEPDINCRACGQPKTDIATVEKRIRSNMEITTEEINLCKNELAIAEENKKKKNAITFKLNEKVETFRKHTEAANAIDRLKSEIKLLEGQKLSPTSNPHEATVLRLRSALRATEDALGEIEAQQKTIKDELELLEAAKLTLSPKGVRYHMLEKVAPRLTADTNKYLELLSDGAIRAVWSTVARTSTGEYREKFSIQAQMEGRTKFGLLSGGEKRKVRLACFLALQDLVASRASKNIELFVADEVDHALDTAGLERLMTLLEEKGKTKSTILVISHNEMREWIPNYSVVTRKDGVSTITGYLNA